MTTWHNDDVAIVYLADYALMDAGQGVNKEGGKVQSHIKNQRETTKITQQTVPTLCNIDSFSPFELVLVRFLYSSRHVVAEEHCIGSISSEVSFHCWEVSMAVSRSCRIFTSFSSKKSRSTSCSTLCSIVTRSSSFCLFFSFFSNTQTLLSSSSCIVSLLASA